MALTELHFEFEGKPECSIRKDWSHTGVVGSGDLEILMERKEQNGKFTVKVVTPVKGFDQVWEKVLERFSQETKIGDVAMEINDNNGTPFVVSLRLKQAWQEARGGERS